MWNNVNLIVARGINGEIGSKNNLLWNLPTDMRFFKHTTMGHTVVMGRKTWESIGSKPLKGRTNIVITNSKSGSETINGQEVIFMGAKIFEIYLVTLYTPKLQGKVFIIGGAEIYKEFAYLADVMYITEVEREYPEADTFFKCKEEDWKEEATLLISEDSGLQFTIKKFERV